METYTTGTGQVLQVHDRTAECDTYGCPIHNPTDPHADWPTHWRADRGIMERICPHGVGHPDGDELGFIRRNFGMDAATSEAVHGCCGVCDCRHVF